MIQRGTVKGVLFVVDVFYLDLKKRQMHERTLRYTINNTKRFVNFFYRPSKLSEAC